MKKIGGERFERMVKLLHQGRCRFNTLKNEMTVLTIVLIR